ncbi:response regulator transcription factor [Orrella marina]|uniref:Transcriptional regulator n=1 Tax=Orrella marina TaxID=2163011 RepID=A0A2R4XMZ8_9BURK|nr:response regulator transcription factor [Orrella marina]AWB35182.1 transcriptional regulator [Orrella marina]
MAAGQHVLIIEDHEALNAMFCRVLERAGHKAIGLSSAEDLQEYASLAEVDTFIVDWNLPEESGVTLLKRLRPIFPNASFIMVTARSGVESQLDGYASGADLCLSKPVKGQELLRAVEIVSERRRGSPTGSADDSDQIAFLYRDRLCLEVAGSTISLSLSEAKVMAALAAAPQSTLESWQIAEILQSDSQIVNGHAIEVRISRLRKKLVVALSGNPIAFVRGVGYRLSCQVVVR